MKTQLHSKPESLSDRLYEITQYSEVKRMADSLIALQQARAFRSLAVLSVLPGEGKTLFASALAVAYTDADASRVLVVDTATIQDSNSLNLKDCFNSHFPAIDYLSLEDYRRGAPVHKKENHAGNDHSASSDPWGESTQALEPEVVVDGTVSVMLRKRSDQSLIRSLARERSAQYGLVLLDTAALTAQNKRNTDPLLVARAADASVLVVSPRLLNSPQLNAHLKLLRDPAMHLIGIVSNEEFFQ